MPSRHTGLPKRQRRTGLFESGTAGEHEMGKVLDLKEAERMLDAMNRGTPAPKQQPQQNKSHWTQFVRGKRTPGEMNKSEAAYAEHLEDRKTLGEILWYAFEPV